MSKLKLTKQKNIVFLYIYYFVTFLFDCDFDCDCDIVYSSVDSTEKSLNTLTKESHKIKSSSMDFGGGSIPWQNVEHCWLNQLISLCCPQVLTEEEQRAGLQQPSGIGQRPWPMAVGDFPQTSVKNSESSSPQTAAGSDPDRFEVFWKDCPQYNNNMNRLLCKITIRNIFMKILYIHQ